MKPYDFSHLNQLEEDKMAVFMLGENQIRGALLNGSRMVNQMKANHDLGIMEALILGHAYLAVGLLVSDMKGHERIVIELDTVGPVRGLVVESNSLGEVRGYLKNNRLEINSQVKSWNPAPYIGQGFLLFSRYLAQESSPFTGQVVLQHSTMAKDLAYYFLTSEQRPTSFNLSVFFNQSGLITGAGGMFLQALPDAEQNTLDLLTDIVEQLPSLGSMIAGGQAPEDIITETFKDFSPQILAERPVVFNCRCSKNRFGSFIAAMEQIDIQDILEKGPFPLETLCHNCNSLYSFSKEEILNLAEKKLN